MYLERFVEELSAEWNGVRSEISDKEDHRKVLHKLALVASPHKYSHEDFYINMHTLVNVKVKICLRLLTQFFFWFFFFCGAGD